MSSYSRVFKPAKYNVYDEYNKINFDDLEGVSKITLRMSEYRNMKHEIIRYRGLEDSLKSILGLDNMELRGFKLRPLDNELEKYSKPIELSVDNIKDILKLFYLDVTAIVDNDKDTIYIYSDEYLDEYDSYDLNTYIHDSYDFTSPHTVKFDYHKEILLIFIREYNKMVTKIWDLLYKRYVTKDITKDEEKILKDYNNIQKQIINDMLNMFNLNGMYIDGDCFPGVKTINKQTLTTREILVKLRGKMKDYKVEDFMLKDVRCNFNIIDDNYFKNQLL